MACAWDFDSRPEDKVQALRMAFKHVRLQFKGLELRFKRFGLHLKPFGTKSDTIEKCDVANTRDRAA